MRALLTPRVIAGSITRQQNLELNAAVFARCENLFIKALGGGKQLSREAMCALLARIENRARRSTCAAHRRSHDNFERESRPVRVRHRLF
jgi:hypothetical protein